MQLRQARGPHTHRLQYFPAERDSWIERYPSWCNQYNVAPARNATQAWNRDWTARQRWPIRKL